MFFTLLFQVSLHTGSVYQDCQAVLLTPLPLPPTYNVADTLSSVATILSSDLSKLPHSILATILSKVHLIMLASTQLCPAMDMLKDTNNMLEEVVRECQTRNYQDIAWCVTRTRQVWLNIKNQ